MEQQTRAQTAHLSSNTTLFWRIFLPVFGSVFVTGLVLSFWLVDPEQLYMSMRTIWTSRIVSALCWLGWLYLLRQSYWKLLRVDADDAYIYVTNYWTTLRYPWADVEHLAPNKMLGKKVMYIWLKSPGRFGQRIVFIPGDNFTPWMEAHGKMEMVLNSKA